LFGKKTRPPYSNLEYRGRDISRGTTSVYRFLAITALESVKQHSCSVTGTPVAAYLKISFVRCTARRMYSVWGSHYLAPTGNSLQGSSKLTYSSSNAFNSCILLLYTNKVKTYLYFKFIFIQLQ